MLYEQNRVDMEAPEQTTLDFSQVPHVLGVPRYMFRSCLRKCGEAIKAALRRDAVVTFESELWVWFFAGVVKQRWKDCKRQSAVETRAAKVAGSER